MENNGKSSFEANISSSITKYENKCKWIDRRYSNIFSLLNRNYLLDDIENIDNDLKQDNCIENIWIIYQVKNCYIEKPIAYLNGNVSVNETIEEFQQPQNNEQTVKDSSIVLFKLNPKNSFQMEDYRQMKNESKFCFRLLLNGNDYSNQSNSCGIIFKSSLCQGKIFQLNGKKWPTELFVLAKQLTLLNGTNTIRNKENKPILLKIFLGHFQLSFDNNSSNKNELSFSLDKANNHQDFHFNVFYFNLVIKFMNLQCLDNNDKYLECNDGHSLNSRSFQSTQKRTFIHLAEVKRVMSLAKIKSRSATIDCKDCNEEKRNAEQLLSNKSPTNDFPVNHFQLQSKCVETGDDQTLVGLPNSEIGDLLRSQTLKTEENAFKNEVTLSQSKMAKIEDCLAIKTADVHPTNLLVNNKNNFITNIQDNCKSNVINALKSSQSVPEPPLQMPTSTESKLYDIDHLIKSGLIIVNKINLNKLNTPSVISLKDCTNNISRNIQTPISLKEAVEKSPSYQTANDKMEDDNSIDIKQSNVNKQGKILKQTSLHEIQKSVQYLKYMNKYVLTNKEQFNDNGLWDSISAKIKLKRFFFFR